MIGGWYGAATLLAVVLIIIGNQEESIPVQVVGALILIAEVLIIIRKVRRRRSQRSQDPRQFTAPHPHPNWDQEYQAPPTYTTRPHPSHQQRGDDIEEATVVVDEVWILKYRLINPREGKVRGWVTQRLTSRTACLDRLKELTDKEAGNSKPFYLEEATITGPSGNPEKINKHNYRQP
jgi:hypothetical protein